MREVRRYRLLPAIALLLSGVTPLDADTLVPNSLKPKFGRYALPIQQSHEYLQRHPAPDYWALSPFYVSQMTNSDCALATIATAINALRGLPPLAKDPLVTLASLREILGEELTEKTRDGGEGVTFEEFRKLLLLSLAAYKLDATIELFRPKDTSAATLAGFRQMMSANERSADDVALVYFNQGVVTGDWDGPHLSPIAAYDVERERVLILDVDRQWYGPYWTPDEKLLDAMVRPAPERFRGLAGETGGIVRVSVQRRN
jgi:hypothetical protein